MRYTDGHVYIYIYMFTHTCAPFDVQRDIQVKDVEFKV